MRFSLKNRQTLILASLACIVGFIYFFYHLLLFIWYRESGGEYYSIVLPGDGYPTTFWPRLRELSDGYLRMADHSLFEHRNGLTTMHSLLNPLIFYPLFLIGGFRGVLPLGVFIFAAISFLILYKLAKLLTERFSLSAAFASVFVLIAGLPSLLLPRSINSLKDLVKIFLPFIPDGSPRNRLNFLAMESMMPGLIIFGPFLIFLFLFIKTQKRKYAVFCGILYGLLFYTYTFFWIYASIVFFLASILFMYRKDWKAFCSSIIAGAIGLFLSTYFWFNFFMAKKLPWIDEYLHRSGWVEKGGHYFRTSQWFLYLTMTVALIFLYKFSKRKGRMYIFNFFSILFVAGFVGLNMQVITGTNIQPDHWYSRIIFIPIAFTFLMVGEWLFEIAERKGFKIYATTALVLVMLFVFSGSTHAAYIYAKKKFETFRLPTGIMQSLSWMNSNIEKDAVVLTPMPYLNQLFLFYTPAKIFLPNAAGTMASEEEILERMFMVYKLFGVTDAYMNDELRVEPIGIVPKSTKFPSMYMSLFDYVYFQQFYSQAFDASMHVTPEVTKIPAWKVEQILSDYKTYSFTFPNLKNKYRADYVYVGPLEAEIATTNFDADQTFEKVYDADGVKIYKIKKD